LGVGEDQEQEISEKERKERTKIKEKEEKREPKKKRERERERRTIFFLIFVLSFLPIFVIRVKREGSSKKKQKLGALFKNFKIIK